MEDHNNLDRGAVETLERVATGGRYTLTVVRQTIAQLMDKLDAGDFQQALGLSAVARELIEPLAHAQSYLAVAADARLVKARDLAPGMEIVQVGIVGAVDVYDCGAVACPSHANIKIGEQEMTLHADQEVFVKSDDA